FWSDLYSYGRRCTTSPTYQSLRSLPGKQCKGSPNPPTSSPRLALHDFPDLPVLQGSLRRMVQKVPHLSILNGSRGLLSPSK
ncbi:Hypothetical predicted protein, partial [Pelobates cultripes]